jgi:CBS domain containing-hemolysin-like protein
VAEPEDIVEFEGGALRVLEMSGRRIEWLELRRNREDTEEAD